jgi:hypothetical protein
LDQNIVVAVALIEFVLTALVVIKGRALDYLVSSLSC